MNTDRIQIDEDEEAIDIKEIFRVLYRFKYMIILSVIIFGSASSYHAYFIPNVYQATATVEVSLEKSSSGLSDIINKATETGDVTSDTEKEIIQSRFLSKKILKKVNFSHKYYTTRRYKEIELYKDSPFEVGMNKGYYISFDFYPIDEKSYRLVVKERKDSSGKTWKYNKIHAYDKEIRTEHFHLNIVNTKKAQDAQYRFMITNPADIGNYVNRGVGVKQIAKGSTILHISYSDNVALRAQEAANALASAYIKQSIEKKITVATRKLAFVDKQLKIITDRLRGSAIKIEEFKISSNTISLNAQTEKAIHKIDELEIQLAEITIKGEMLNTLNKQIKSGKNLGTLIILGSESDMSLRRLDDMIKELQSVIKKKKMLREDYTEMYSEIRKLKKVIVELEKVIVITIKSLNTNAKELKVLLEKSIVNQTKHINKLPAQARKFGELERIFTINEKLYSYLLRKRAETAVLKAATVSNNRIIDDALLPKGAIKPKRNTIVLVGLVLGLIFGIALAFLRSFLDNRIKEKTDITSVTSIPMLGEIPHIINDNNKVDVFFSPKSPSAESFRHLRASLKYMSSYKHAHTIVVTSTVQKEGKTTISINLGGILSMSGKKTIILNLDMRKPALHKKFGLPNINGMSTLLSGNAGLNEVIQKTKYEHLDIISSGPIPPNPSELIESKHMEEMLKKLKETYDVIIIDTPPVGLVSDATTLMHLADTSIYVFRSDYSQKDFLDNIKELSSMEKINGLCILLNDTKHSGNKYGYYE